MTDFNIKLIELRQQVKKLNKGALVEITSGRPYNEDSWKLYKGRVVEVREESSYCSVITLHTVDNELGYFWIQHDKSGTGNVILNIEVILEN